jgi:hypothetical protein
MCTNKNQDVHSSYLTVYTVCIASWTNKSRQQLLVLLLVQTAPARLLLLLPLLLLLCSY